MINTDLRTYDYYLYGDNDAYGQPTITEEKQGEIKMAIYLNSQSNNNSITYTDAEYIGLTHNPVSDNMIIRYADAKLKVNHINGQGRMKQVWMTKIQ